MSLPGGNYSGYKAGNTPLYSLSAAVVFLGFAVAMVIWGDKDNKEYITILVGLIVTTIPSLIASAFSERVSRDVRNGVVQQKMENALENTGVAEVARQASQTTPAALSALSMLLTQMQADQNSRLTTDKDKDNDG